MTNTKCSWLAAASIAVISTFTGGEAQAQTRTEWQQHNGTEQYAKVNAHRTREMFTAVDVPAVDAPGWFAPTVTNDYFVNARSDVACNTEVDYTYFQTSFQLAGGSILELLELKFASSDFDDGGMVIVNGDKSRAIYVDKGSETSLNLANQIKQGTNRIVVAQADNCKILNKIPAMDLIFQVSGGDLQVAITTDDEGSGEPASRLREPPSEIRSVSRGDVHISTPDGLKYDYQGVGDFILAQTGGNPLIVARQRSWEGKPAASVNKAVALGVGKDRVEFQVQPMRLLINGQSAKLGAQSLPAGGRITVEGRDDYYVRWPGGTYIVRVILRSESLDIGHWQDGSVTLDGLLGNYNGDSSDDMQIRGGAVLATPPSAADLARFGESWRIDRNVFSSPHPEGNGPNDELVAGAKLSAAERDAGTRACRSGGVNHPIALEDCTYDVAVTGSTEFIESAKDFQEAERAQPAQKVVKVPAEPVVDLKTIAAVPSGMNIRSLSDLAAFIQQLETARAEPAQTDSVFPIAGEFFFQQGEKYFSPSGNHYLIFQNDGNLVVYTKENRFVWGINELTGRYGQSAIAIKQEDGNLATYDKNNNWIWSARDVVSPPGTKLYFKDTGQLALVDPSGNELWTSK